MRAATLSVVFFALAGCSTTATLFPVEGPLSKQVPLPMLQARVDGITGNTGDISMELPDGDKCLGKWSSIAPQSVGFSTGAALGAGRTPLGPAWGRVFGAGFSVANVPGVNRGEAMLACASGTVIQVEFFTGSGTANGSGVAQDNVGNTFKVLF